MNHWTSWPDQRKLTKDSFCNHVVLLPSDDEFPNCSHKKQNTKNTKRYIKGVLYKNGGIVEEAEVLGEFLFIKLDWTKGKNVKQQVTNLSRNE